LVGHDEDLALYGGTDFLTRAVKRGFSGVTLAGLVAWPLRPDSLHHGAVPPGAHLAEMERLYEKHAATLERRGDEALRAREGLLDRQRRRVRRLSEEKERIRGELDRLAAQFNGLLSRLSAQRARNRAFIQQAAHQLRTPLTVVRGESALGLERPRDAADYRETLARVRRAAEQMSHRVDELFVLAEAEAGQRPSLTDDVELDGLALECSDLLRGRAQAERRTLELRRVDPVLVRGNATLLREALVELLANAIKHGAAERPVAVSVYREDGDAVLSVSSGGPRWVPAENGTEPGAPDTHGLGLAIVRWIADVHHGTLRHEYEDGANVFAVRWPV